MSPTRRTVLALLGGTAAAAGGSPSLADTPRALRSPLALLRTGDLGGLPVADLACEGRAGRWILDTGASRSVVDRRLADALGLDRTGRSDVRLLGRRLRADRVWLPSLATVDGQPLVPADEALAIDLAAYRDATGEELLGIVGLPGLGEGTTLDLAGGRWWRGGAGTETAPAGPSLRIDRPPADVAWPAVPVGLPDGSQGWCLVDSGFAGVLLLQAAAAAPWLAGPRAPPRVRVRELAATVEVAMGRFSSVRLGDVVLDDVPVLLDTGAPAVAGPAGPSVIGLVGTGMVEHGRLHLGRPGGPVGLDWPGSAPRFPGGFGLALRPGGAGLRVSAVVEGSPADRAGLRPGDRVEQVDGQALTDARPSTTWAALRGRDAVVLGVRAAGDGGDGPSRAVPLARERFLPRLDPR